MLVFAPGLAKAQQLASGLPYPTGLLDPTPEEQDWMDQNLKKTASIKLNQLGLDRINQHRSEQGLPILSRPVVELGEEMDEKAAADEPAQLAFQLARPRAVDNSRLPWFPPVASQGSQNSCASFAITYYTATHMMGFARSWFNKNNDSTTKFSPAWTYNMVNGGQDFGSSVAPSMAMLLRHGAATLADVPYTSTRAVKGDFLSWSQDPAVWRRAISYRMSQAGVLQGVNTPRGLGMLKDALLNGFVLVFGTDVGGWRFATISNDTNTAADDAFVGLPIAWSVAPNIRSAHAMTVVGYNDDIWCDINNNGRVDDGEKGALRICNSWGTDWDPGQSGIRDGGFTWLSYDALRQVSAVPGGNFFSRHASPWQANAAFWMLGTTSYTPKAVAQFTVSHRYRNQLFVNLARSATTTTIPAAWWSPGALFGHGGAFAFNGGASAVSGSFAFDLSDIAPNGLTRYYVALGDGFPGFPGSISDFRITDASGNTLATAAAGIPGAADYSTWLAYANLNLNPPTVTSGVVAGRVNAPFIYATVAAGGPTSYGAVGLPPGLAINPATGVINGAPTRAGRFVVSLRANNASGSGGGTLIINVGNPFGIRPVITSAAVAGGMVALPFGYTITAHGDPFAFSAVGLPPGLNLDPGTGLISGTPFRFGVFTVKIGAVNNAGKTEANLVITINPPPANAPVITSANLVRGEVGNPFTYKIAALNNPTSFAVNALPFGLALDQNTGVITGRPLLACDFFIVLFASNANGIGIGQLRISIAGPSSFGPPNDNFTNRISLWGMNVAALGGNNNSTAEPGEPPRKGNPASRSVWWRWTSPVTGPATISTAGSTFDTILGVYTGAAVNALVQVAADDDANPDKTSAVNFNATMGTVYQIAVDGYAGAVGAIALNIQVTGVPPAPANDNFANRIPLNGANASALGRNTGATAEPGEPAHFYAAKRSVWWSWTAPDNGTARINTIGSGFDTVLAVYTGANLNALNLVAYNDDVPGIANGNSAVRFDAAAGTTYQIAVDGYGTSDQGEISLAVQLGPPAPVNDNFAGRIVMTGDNDLRLGTTMNATAEDGEAAHAGSPPTNSVWWSWTPTASGVATLSTEGSAFDTTLEVYTGDFLANLVSVAWNDHVPGTNFSRAQFLAEGGVTYQIAVDGYNGSTGAVRLTSQLLVNGPPNDDFALASGLDGMTPSYDGSNQGATAQTGEPAHAANAAAKSVWWTWTAPQSGWMSFNTAGSSFDTVLAVYTGAAVNALTIVAADDDSGGGQASSVNFWADAGVTYRIAVDGYAAATGTIRLSGELVVADDYLYATDFESFPESTNSIVGFDGWLGSNIGGGVQGLDEFFMGEGRGAYVGFGSPSAGPVRVYRPVDFQPIPAGRPIVTLTVLVRVEDSVNGHSDVFRFNVRNRSGQSLGALVFDTLNHSVSSDDGSGVLAAAAAGFDAGTSYKLTCTIDFALNTWSASLDNTALFVTRNFHGLGFTRDLGDVAVEWSPRDLGNPGDNYLAMDNYTLAAGTNLAAPVITGQPASVTNAAGDTVIFSVSAIGTPVLQYQWQFNLADLPGATNATLTLPNLDPSQAGSYRVRVSNLAGQALSQIATLTVLQTTNVPCRLINAAYSSHGFSFTLQGNPNRSYAIEFTQDLKTWTQMGVVQTDDNGVALFNDPAAPATSRIIYIYRARSVD